jgi:hypothetical protein
MHKYYPLILEIHNSRLLKKIHAGLKNNNKKILKLFNQSENVFRLIFGSL